jgi:hypothetical protein
MSKFKEITKEGIIFYKFDFNGLESRNQPKKLPIFFIAEFSLKKKFNCQSGFWKNKIIIQQAKMHACMHACMHHDQKAKKPFINSVKFGTEESKQKFGKQH